LSSNELKPVFHELAVQTEKLLEEKKKEDRVTASAMNKVTSEHREAIRELFVEMANILREDGLTIPEIRRYVAEMRTVSI